MNKELKNERWKLIFAKYFLKKYQEFESKRFLENNCDHEDDYAKKLIEELNKPFLRNKGILFNRMNSNNVGRHLVKDLLDDKQYRNPSVNIL